MARQKKSKFRFPALGGIITTLGGIAVAAANDPHILATAAGKIGISAALLGSIVQAVVKPLTRQEHER